MLTIDHARNGEVMIAFAMNGEQIPFLNDFRCGSSCPAGARSAG
jgi:DMSO/TMAO reductase YedYZ molybdopterin-dependent catalytic subunit